MDAGFPTPVFGISCRTDSAVNGASASIVAMCKTNPNGCFGGK